MSRGEWCAGWPQSRGPHVEGGLITIDANRGVMLCRSCWSLWVRDHGQGDDDG